ncbi:MAG: transketolase family protein [Georgenia sp.]
MSSQREAWAAELTELAARDDRVVVLDGDLGTSTKADGFAATHPDQFFQMGIAEQNLVGVAAGMASVGAVPWAATFGVFLTQRALDQIRMLISQTGANVKLAGHYTGLLNGGAGKTHQDIEDLAILRAMPGMTVIAPADAAETRAAVRWATEYDGPVYLRVARDPDVDVDTGGELRPDHLVELRRGTDVTVITTGIQTARTTTALDLLARRGISARHLHAAFLKPLSERTVMDAVGDAKEVVTVEEHSVHGGLGGLVAEAVASAGRAVRVTRVGLADQWSESAPNDFLLDRFGLSPQRVAERIEAVVGAVEMS